MSVTHAIGMAGRLITGDQREFVVEAWDGVNRSGWQPLDDKVLILMEEHVEMTTGGIHIPGAAAERQSVASETGRVIAIGPVAFVWNDDLTRKWEGRAPQPGDRVYLERYSGQLIRGHDGRHYRLVSQRCVGALALPPPEPEPAVEASAVEERVFPLPMLMREVPPAETPRRRRRVAT